jgi:hypothetical protein
MPTDPLTEAVAAMESAWRRLREVLDDPDVAAALVAARDKPRPMSTAPRDGTWVMLHMRHGGKVSCRWETVYAGWPDDFRQYISDDSGVGWSPVK